MSHARIVIPLIVIALASSAASAQEPNYNLVDGGWWNINPDEASSEDGWFLGGGFELTSK